MMNQKENLRLARKHFGRLIADRLDSRYRSFVIRSFSITPEWFWHVPASMSGKYHPRRTKSLGGLVEHTKLASLWAGFLLNLYDIRDTITRNEVLVAVLLHDLFKFSGPTGQRENYVKRHGVWAATALTEYWASAKRSPAGIDSDSMTRIIQAVACHMGRWGDGPSEDELKEGDQAKLVFRIVQEADYCASQDIDSMYAATFGARQL